MHLSIARHFCGGEMADMKISFSGVKATCGMETDKATCSEHDNITSDCCRNEFSMLTVDNYLSSSSMQVQEITQPVFQLYFLPLIQSLYSFDAALKTYTDASPPDMLMANTVSLPKICVFRI